jgi:hypothetical protein
MYRYIAIHDKWSENKVHMPHNSPPLRLLPSTLICLSLSFLAGSDYRTREQDNLSQWACKSVIEMCHKMIFLLTLTHRHCDEKLRTESQVSRR